MKGEQLPSHNPGSMYYSGLAMEIGFALEDSQIRSASSHISTIKKGWNWINAAHQFTMMCATGPLRADIRLAQAWGSLNRPFTDHVINRPEDFLRSANFNQAALDHFAYLRGLTEVPSTEEQRLTTIAGFNTVRRYYEGRAFAELTGGSEKWRRTLAV